MQITVNKEHEFDLTGNDIVPNIIRLPDGTYHLIQDQKSYKITVLDIDIQSKEMTLLINSREMKLSVKDDFDILVKKLGFTLNTTQKIKEIKAPMPGLVLDIMIKVGESVTVGTPLLILEAMKMENVIKALGEGIVKKILVNKKDAIEKGSIMIEME